MPMLQTTSENEELKLPASKVRVATPDDYALIKDLCTKFLDNSPYKDLYNSAAISHLVSGFLYTPADKIVLLYEDKGILAGLSSPFLFNPLKKMATELAWWVEPQYRQTSIGKELLDAFEEWAKNTGCELVTMVCLDDLLGKYYERRGYSLKERAYMKVL